MIKSFRSVILALLLPLSSCSNARTQMLEDDTNNMFSVANAVGERSVIAQFDVPDDGIVHALAWSPTGKALLVTSKQGSLARIYDLDKKTLSGPMLISEHGVSARGAILYDDGSFIVPTSGVSSNRNSVITILRKFSSNGIALASLLHSSGSADFRDINILNISASTNGQILGFTSVDTTAKSRGLPPVEQWPAVIMSLKPERILATSQGIVGRGEGLVRNVALSASGFWASILDNVGKIRIWNRAVNRVVGEINVCNPKSITCNMSLISSDGKYLIVNGGSGGVQSNRISKIVVDNDSVNPKIWSIEEGRIVGEIKKDQDMTPRSFDIAAWSPDDSEISIADSSGIDIWKFVNGSTKLSFVRQVPKYEDGRVIRPLSAIAYSNSGMLAVAVGNHVVIYK